MRRAYVIAFVCCAVCASAARAASRAELYDLQERCAKRTEQEFRREWGDGIVREGGAIVGTGSFQNHYNVRLNKCFYLLTYETPASNMVTLFDINEQKEYGMLFERRREPLKVNCRVGEKTCSSEAEWTRLIAPFMEE
jgi:hypothetical protein